MTDNAVSKNDVPTNAGKQGGWSWGIVGLVGSLLVALLLSFLFVLLTLGGLGGEEGGAYAGLAAIFVGVFIFLAVLIGLGFLLFFFFLATGRKKALVVAVAQIVLAGAVLVIFLAYIAS